MVNHLYRLIYRLPLILLLLGLSACTVTVTQNIATTATEPASPPSGQPFIDALRQRLGQEEIVPDFGRLEIPALYTKGPTFAFPENQGTVLRLNIFGYPDAKGTEQLVAPLIGIGAEVAEQHEISLSGIEVVFYRRFDSNPMLVWANTPPWEADQIFLSPP